MKASDSQDNYVKLVTASGLQEADTWKAVLEANGIQVFLRHEAMAPLLGVSTDTLGAVELWVPRAEAARAMELLQDERVAPEVDEEP
jgi:hypothetical protein